MLTIPEFRIEETQISLILKVSDKLLGTNKMNYWELTRWERRFQWSKSFAFIVHQEQRYGHYPYSYHLQEVVNTLLNYGACLTDSYSAPILVAAWMHDSLEDTAIEIEDIQVRFGLEVARIVWLVTDENGSSRRQRKAKTYAKLRLDEKAIALKLADRIANIKASQQNNPKLLKMYCNEQSQFISELRPYSSNFLTLRLWAALEESLKLNLND
jgi:(p)ppGpp synthase/HD superfamily hydrolase